MSTIHVEARRVNPSMFDAFRVNAAPDLQTDLRRARKLATLLDSQFSVGTFKFGWDAIIGLIPVAGDTVTTLAGLYPIYVARRHGLPRRVQLRMAANLALDYVVGIVPVAGDAFDAAMKANLRNLALLEAAAEKHLRRQDSKSRGGAPVADQS